MLFGRSFFQVTIPRMRLILLEPVILLYMMSSHMQFNLFSPLLFTKVCMVSYGHNATFCQNYNHSKSHGLGHDIQAYSSKLMFWSNLCLTIPSMLLAPFLGHFGDRFGKKFPVIFPAIGALLSAINYAICSGLPRAPAELLLVSSLLQGITGGFTGILLAVFSWAASLSSIKTRTSRLGLIEFANLLGTAMAPAVGGAVARFAGYPWAFTLAGCLNVTQIFYVLFFLQVEKSADDLDRSLTCRDVCHLDSLRQMWTFIKISVRDVRFRFRLCIVILCLAITWMISTGTNEVRYLFIKTLNLGWDVFEYNLFIAEDAAVRGITLVTILPFMKQCLMIKDFPIMLGGLLSKLAMFGLWAAAKNSFLIFIAPLMGFLAAAVSAAGRSAASKCVQKSDLGKLFAVLGVIENLSSLSASVIFQNVYQATLKWYPGFAFVLADIILLIPALLLLLTLPLLRISEAKDNQVNDLQHQNSCENIVATESSNPEGLEF